MSYVLGIYLDLGIHGILYGIILGYSFFWGSSGVLVLRSNWEQLSKDAINRSIAKIENQRHAKRLNQEKEKYNNRSNKSKQFKTVKNKDLDFSPYMSLRENYDDDGDGNEQHKRHKKTEIDFEQVNFESPHRNRNTSQSQTTDDIDHMT